MNAGAEAPARRSRLRIAALTLAAIVAVPALVIAILWITTPGPREAPGWTQLPELPSARGEVASTTDERGGALYVAGGFEFPAATSVRVSVYRPANGSWEELPPLPAPRHHAAAAMLGDDLIVSGGARGSTSRSPERDAWILPAGADAWERLEPMPEGRYAHRMVSLGDTAYAIGGEGPSASVLAYSEPTGWSARAAMPQPRHHLAAVARGGEIWALGGRDAANEPLAAVHVYDPAADSWREGPALPNPVSAAVEGVIGGTIHLVGGEDPAVLGGGVIDSHLALDPGAESWRELPPPPLAVHGAAGGTLDGGLLIAGGAARQGALSVLAWTGYATRFEP